MKLESFCQIVTLFAKEQGASYKKYVLQNCYFAAEPVERIKNAVVSTVSNFVCRIPKEEAEKAGGKGFLPAMGDIVVKGEAEGEINEAEGKFAADILAKYMDKAFVIRAVSANTLFKECEHYRASGVKLWNFR